MTPPISFRPHVSTIGSCLVAYISASTLIGLLLGLVDFLHVWEAVLVGVVAGMTHALCQWAFTSVRVEHGVIVSRNFIWVRELPIGDIQTVHRVRRRGWNGVSIRLVDGEDIVLAAPTSTVLTPNPGFTDDVSRLCAAIALSDDVWSSY